MKTKPLDYATFKQYTESFNKEIKEITYLPDVIEKILKFKTIELGLIESNGDQLINFVRDGYLSKTYRITLGSAVLGETEIFNNSDSLNNKTFSHLLDIIVGNSIYYLYASNKTKAEYYTKNFLILAIIYQNNIIKRLVNKIYASSDKKQVIDQITIVLAYSIYRYLLGYAPATAKVKATDLLLDSELLKGSNFDSRVQISISMNNLINDNSKDMYDTLFNAGLLTELKNSKSFIKALATIYDIRLIRILFTNPKFKVQTDSISYYVYKIIELTVSDYLHEWNQYNKFKSSMNTEFRTAHKLVEAMLNDYARSLSSLKV